MEGVGLGLSTKKTPTLGSTAIERSKCSTTDVGNGLKQSVDKTMKMKVLAAFTLIGTSVLTSKTVVAKDLSDISSRILSYDEYLQKYDKRWPDKDQYEIHRRVYLSNLGKIHDQYVKGSYKGYSVGVNQFTDMNPREVWKGYDKSRKLNRNKHQVFEHESTSLQERHLLLGKLETVLGVSLRDPIESLPSRVDWRKQGVSTPVKNQGMCGSCWAFASTAVLESHLAIQTGKLFELSVQELVSCSQNPRKCGGAGGCAGSTSELAFEHVQEHGMVTEWQFGYQSYRPHGPLECSLKELHQRQPSSRKSLRHGESLGPGRNTSGYYEGAVMGIGGWVSLPSNDYVAVMNAVAKLGPLAVSVACHPWISYESGVFPGANFSSPDMDPRVTDVNHLVVLEGYGKDETTGQEFWIVRNSWGPNWGEGGYIRLERSSEIQCGLDVTPADGVACTHDQNDQEIVPPNALICGNSGILYDVTIPIHVFEP